MASLYFEIICKWKKYFFDWLSLISDYHLITISPRHKSQSGQSGRVVANPSIQRRSTGWPPPGKFQVMKVSVKFAARGPINNMPALVQIMAELMMVSLLTHIGVTLPQC